SVAENQSLTRDGSNLRRRSEVYRGVVQSFPKRALTSFGRGLHRGSLPNRLLLHCSIKRSKSAACREHQNKQARLLWMPCNVPANAVDAMQYVLDRD
ncbi:hypothetical protein, partial [Xanthomonas arboricola]|uniref:hypothetical protein n=1 Tax=Xanthomonas arboricola TaxID=56448 RepID=UPI001CA5C83E